MQYLCMHATRLQNRSARTFQQSSLLGSIHMIYDRRHGIISLVNNSSLPENGLDNLARASAEDGEQSIAQLLLSVCVHELVKK